MADFGREPCPDRILDDAGSGFAMGAVAGSIWHFSKGTATFPRGHRFSGGIQSVRLNAHPMAGAFAAWASVFSIIDCAAVYVRQKEDPWNSILAGASTGGLLSFRSGLRSAGKSAVLSGALLALVEGVRITVESLASPVPSKQQVLYQQYPPFEEPATEVEKRQSWWFGGGGKKQENSATSIRSEAKVLESFDSPTPMPDFEIK